MVKREPDWRRPRLVGLRRDVVEDQQQGRGDRGLHGERRVAEDEESALWLVRRFGLREQSEEGDMTKEQEDAVYAAYLGVCVLQTMVRKVGLTLAVTRSAELLGELSTTFPFIQERVAKSILRKKQ